MNELSQQTFYEPEELSYLIFSLNDKKYALDAVRILEIINLPRLVLPQKLPIMLCGLLKYDNLIINIVNSYKLFDLPNQTFTPKHQLLIIKAEETIFGLIVENVFDLITISSLDIHPKPYNSENNIIKFISFYNDEMIFIMDVDYTEKYLKETENTFIDVQDITFANDQISEELFAKSEQQLISKNNNLPTQLYTDSTDYLTFLAGEHQYCLKLEYVKKIIDANKIRITPIPETPPFIKGTFFFYGDFYTVIDLPLFFNLPINEQNKNEKIILIENEDFKIALWAQEIIGTQKITQENLYNLPNRTDNQNNYYTQITMGENIYYILNFKNIITDNKLLIFDTTN